MYIFKNTPITEGWQRKLTRQVSDGVCARACAGTCVQCSLSLRGSVCASVVLSHRPPPGTAFTPGRHSWEEGRSCKARGAIGCGPRPGTRCRRKGTFGTECTPRPCCAPPPPCSSAEPAGPGPDRGRPPPRRARGRLWEQAACSAAASAPLGASAPRVLGSNGADAARRRSEAPHAHGHHSPSCTDTRALPHGSPGVSDLRLVTKTSHNAITREKGSESEARDLRRKNV